MEKTLSRLVLAGTGSGCGKTTARPWWTGG